ncbi:MAG: class I SAM-dependent methyltransferase [Chloroflexi bacterium]|nr:MAG: class I SAM-dependent methyltransferase [Chloroflexota bacterium]
MPASRNGSWRRWTRAWRRAGRSCCTSWSRGSGCRPAPASPTSAAARAGTRSGWPSASASRWSASTPLPDRVRFTLGAVEALPAPDAAFDLVWFRDALEHVERLDRAFAEIRRVLRPGGRALVYSLFATRLPPPEDVEWLWRTFANAPTAHHGAAVEAAIAGAGLRIDERIDLGSEWGELAEERAAQGTRRLLHAARLLRAPDRYAERFGRAAYDVMLADCYWHVYRMLGKTGGRVYLLS